MPSWNEILGEFEAEPEKAAWLDTRMRQALVGIRKTRSDRNVLLYGSAFLQKPQAPPYLLQVDREDINGMMSVIYGMDVSKGLTLVLHTPGGVINAAETLVAYLRQKFDYIEVIVPTYAMSAGTMIALAADRIVMGRHSQLGPIDPQMPFGGRSVSARGIVDQFEQAKADILGDALSSTPGNLDAAHVWAPILQSVGPSLLVEAKNALLYGEEMVGRWLADYMFKAEHNAKEKGDAVAKHFNDAATHKSHGRRIGREEARAQGIVVEDLEDDQDLQEEVLTAYHVMTIVIEKSNTARMMHTDAGRRWIKPWMSPEELAARTRAAEAAEAAKANRPPLHGPPPGGGKRRR